MFKKEEQFMIDSKTIIESSNLEAKGFFLKNESYCNIDLPHYINFEELLNSLKNDIAGRSLKDICFDFRNKKPKDIEQINHILLANKDGLFAWRPLMLLHPVIYVLLVNLITTDNNWNIIVDKFNNTRDDISDKIKCISLPVISLSDEKDKAAQIDKWWHEVEQKSIQLALDYNNITHIDLTNCYGSIYTHSIPWAIHGKDECKANLNLNRDQRIYMFGDDIDDLIRSASYGQTNGIPQGSILMDFIAEIVLNYLDSEIYKELSNIECKIIRYRDDYRVFTHNEIDSLKVLKIISEVTAKQGLKLNEKKTKISNEIIKDSLKPDKWKYIDCLDCKNKRQRFQKHLLLIYNLSLEFPNSGSVRKELLFFYKKLNKIRVLNEDILVLISIVTNIALKNPSTYPVSSAIISKLLSFIDETEQELVLDKIIKKFDSIPNTGLVDIWLQRITISSESFKTKEFNEKLCDIILKNETNESLWDVSWLKPSLSSIIKDTTIIDDSEIENLPPVIEINEINLFRIHSIE